MHPTHPGPVRLVVVSCLTLFSELALIPWLSSKLRRWLWQYAVAGLFLTAAVPGFAQRTTTKHEQVAGVPGLSVRVAKVCERCIRANEEFLASDALRGRGSATPDELIAATYVASMLRAYGIDPAGDDGGYIQRAAILRRKITSPPQLSAANANWTYGKDFLVAYLAQTDFSGPLQEIHIDEASGDVASQVKAGAVVLLTGKDLKRVGKVAVEIATGRALAVIAPTAATPERFESLGRELPKLGDRLDGASNEMLGDFNLLKMKTETIEKLKAIADGTQVHFSAPADSEKTSTWNAVGILQGSDPNLRAVAILLSAHLDHLGIGEAVNGDNIYNGADDDASGTAAVLELARVLGAGTRPRRTVIFALFGSEETGGLGSTYFREHPPVPLKNFAANLEFEMIGRPDASVKTDTLWLTGWERSNLGPTLAAHGANLVADPHPKEQFFMRSDNYVLAKKGVVAQTVSSYGLHKDYHQPSDDAAHLDFKHMNAAIGSLLEPVRWLVNSDFKPQWNKGGQP